MEVIVKENEEGLVTMTMTHQQYREIIDTMKKAENHRMKMRMAQARRCGYEYEPRQLKDEIIFGALERYEPIVPSSRLPEHMIPRVKTPQAKLTPKKANPFAKQ